MESLAEKFKKKLKKDLRKYKWFLRYYLPDMKYQNFTTQINSFDGEMSKTVKEAIEKYLKSE